MKLQIFSDTHLNYTPFMKWDIIPEADVVVIPGDLCSSPKAAKVFFRNMGAVLEGKEVIYVLGNHEYYGGHMYDSLDEYKEAVSDYPNVHLLEKETLSLDGVTFVGTTLWSDLSDPLGRAAVQNLLNDFILIGTNEGLLTGEMYHREHMACKGWLLKELEARKADERVVAVTHHSPSCHCRNRKYDYEKGARYTRQGFCTDLNTFIQMWSPIYWVYGHTHSSVRFTLGHTTIISNQYGYTGETDMNYNPGLLVEV